MLYASTTALLLAQAGVAQLPPPAPPTGSEQYWRDPLPRQATAQTRPTNTAHATPDPTFSHRPGDLFDNPDCCGVDSTEILNEALPEQTSVDGEFLDDDVTPSLQISEPTYLVLSFIGEGAIYYNSLGYITYPAGAIDGITKADVDTNSDGLVEPFELRQIPGVSIGMIFAHASAVGGGGGLHPNEARIVGNREFPPGHVVDFFLTQNGWNSDRTVKDYLRDTGPGTLTFYTIDRFNPEPDPDSQRHVAMMFTDDALDSILFGFEDLHRTDNTQNLAGFTSDEDFNDNVFCVTSLTIGALAQTGVPVAGDLCPADADGNGVLDTLDVLRFIPWYFEGDQRADLDDDGAVTVADLLAFLALYTEACA